jgi:hypothetical protein
MDNDDHTKNVVMKADSMYCVSYNNRGKCYRNADSCSFRYGKHPNESKEYIEETNTKIYIKCVNMINKI